MATVSITVPDVDSMSDEDLADLARMRDGRWSEQTKRLLRKFGTDKLSLNRPWAGTWQGWTCPCCNRTKPQIARKSPAGVLLCELEGHHDHLGDKAGKLFEEINPRTDDKQFNVQVSHAKYGMLQFVERFQRTLICIDCNLAEGNAKKAVGSDMDPDFTFSPREIAKFIRVGDNRIHDLDVPQVKAIWENVKPDIADRMFFAERMARRFAEGKNRREVAVGMRGDMWMDDRAIIWEQVAKAVPALSRGNTIGMKVLTRSISRDAVGNSAKPKSKPPGRAPSDADFAYVETINKEKKHWKLAGDDWTCGCCRRSKRDICRVSPNSGKWMAQVHSVPDWVFGDDDQVSDYWRAGMASRMIVDHVPVLICQDCRLVVTKVKLKDPTIEEESLTIGDIAGVITVASNQMHSFDEGVVIGLAHGNTDLVTGIREYQEHKSRALYYLSQVRLHAKHFRCSEPDALDEVASEFAYADGEELEDGRAYIAWLVAEGRRLEKRKEGE